MDISNLFLHIRTEPKRHGLLLNKLGAEVAKSIEPFSQIHLVDIGPGGLPRGSADKPSMGTIDSFIAHMRQKVTADLENYEPRRFGKRFAHSYNTTMTVVDRYGPCLNCVPDEFSYNFNTTPENTNSLGMRKVPVRKLLHDISNPFPENFESADVVLSSYVFDWIPHDDWRSWKSIPSKFRGLLTAARQDDAVRSVDAIIKPGGYWGVTVGKDSPRWDLLLMSSYTRIDCNLPPCYQIWKKNKVPHDMPKRIFEPPRNLPVEVMTGENTSQRSTFPRSAHY